MVEAMLEQARVPSEHRAARDGRALAWTIQSLSDDEELEPFVEAISDVLWGPVRDQRRDAYADHFRALVNHPDVQLYGRIQGLLDSCETGFLSSEVKKRRQIACYKAIWAIGSLFDSTEPSFQFPPWRFFNNVLEISHYAASARAMIAWKIFSAAHSRLIDLEQHLIKCGESIESGNEPDWTPITSYLDLLRKHDYYHWIIPDASYFDQPPGPADRFVKFSNIINSLCEKVPHPILFEYFSRAAQMDSLPYRWTETINLIRCPSSPFFDIQRGLERALNHVVSTQLNKFNITGWVWMDELMRHLCPFWRPEDPTVPIPTSLIRYLNERNSDFAIGQTLSHITRYLWRAFPQTLIDPFHKHPLMVQTIGDDDEDTEITADQLMTALWRLGSCTVQYYPEAGYLETHNYIDLSGYQPLMDAVSNTGPSSFLPSVMAMIKSCFLRALMKHNFAGASPHPVLPAETAVMLPSDETTQDSKMHHRVAEASIHLLAEFLESCISDPLQWKATETVKRIYDESPCGQVHEAHQIRLALAIRHSFASSGEDLATAVIEKKMFDLYAGVKPKSAWIFFPPRPDERIPWLENSDACETIKRAFIAHADKLASSADSTPTLARVRAIINGLESLHPSHIELAGTYRHCISATFSYLLLR
jgi:hypothetical protein